MSFPSRRDSQAAPMPVEALLSRLTVAVVARHARWSWPTTNATVAIAGLNRPGIPGAVQNEEAKALIAGLLLHVVATEPPATRRLATLRQLLTLPPQRFVNLLEAMQAEETLAGGLIARAANRHLGKADREAAGVLSSAQRHTHFLDSPRLTQAMDGADFSFADLRRESATVYLVLPPDRLDAYGRWLRLLVSRVLGELGRHQTPLPSPAGPWARPPVLFLLDEFAALGRLEAVERAMGLMAGLGVQLWPMLQDLHQLRALYGKRAETFLANAGVIQVFGTNDVETAASWVSRTLGSRTARYETSGTSSGASSSGLAGPASTTVGRSTGSHLTGRALLTPDEVLRLPAGQQILLRAGEPPARIRKIRYFEEKEFTVMLI